MSDDLVKAYNYDIFVDTNFAQWMTFDDSPLLGKPAPSFPLTNLAGETVELESIWRQHAYTIVEFGSFT